MFETIFAVAKPYSQFHAFMLFENRGVEHSHSFDRGVSQEYRIQSTVHIDMHWFDGFGAFCTGSVVTPKGHIGIAFDKDKFK